MSNAEVPDLFAHLKQRASERADRTVERIMAAISNTWPGCRPTSSRKRLGTTIRPAASMVAFIPGR